MGVQLQPVAGVLFMAGLLMVWMGALMVTPSGEDKVGKSFGSGFGFSGLLLFAISAIITIIEHTRFV